MNVTYGMVVTKCLVQVFHWAQCQQLATYVTFRLSSRMVRQLLGALAPTVQGSAVNAGEAEPAYPLAVGEGTPLVLTRLVRLVQSGQFVDFPLLLPHNLELLRRRQASALTGANEASPRRLREVSSLGTWVQCFAIYAAIVLRASSSRALDLMAYLRLVVHKEQCHSRDGCCTTRVLGSWLPTRRPSSGASCTL